MTTGEDISITTDIVLPYELLSAAIYSEVCDKDCGGVFRCGVFGVIAI